MDRDVPTASIAKPTLRPDVVAGSGHVLRDSEFLLFQKLFGELIGLHLPLQKKQLVAGRLGRRLTPLGLDSFKAYHDLLRSGEAKAELQVAIDLITTNETSFFREKDHFELLAREILPSLQGRRPLRAWCAASSTGEEPYTLAMVFQKHLGTGNWRLVASDINAEVLAHARRGLYAIERAASIPQEYLRRFCLKGTGEYQGKFLIERDLRAGIDFRQANLIDLPADLKGFDLIFLRNVMIYFDAPTKERILARIWERMEPGAWLVLSHSESLTGLRVPGFVTLRPSVYRKPGGA